MGQTKSGEEPTHLKFCRLVSFAVLRKVYRRPKKPEIEINVYSQGLTLRSVISIPDTFLLIFKTSLTNCFANDEISTLRRM